MTMECNDPRKDRPQTLRRPKIFANSQLLTAGNLQKKERPQLLSGPLAFLLVVDSVSGCSSSQLPRSTDVVHSELVGVTWPAWQVPKIALRSHTW